VSCDLATGPSRRPSRRGRRGLDRSAESWPAAPGRNAVPDAHEAVGRDEDDGEEDEADDSVEAAAQDWNGHVPDVLLMTMKAKAPSQAPSIRARPPITAMISRSIVPDVRAIVGGSIWPFHQT
jgi:hypothetical protein